MCFFHGLFTVYLDDGPKGDEAYSAFTNIP